ncbi:hypothetical protein [Stenotrophomonas phage vB_SmeS_BUCT700]|uniref:Uncharacterized protein n=1 Tax=Stenotrophomonas phage vB_SmeS_BUCT700 TaxID=2924895 RepID=A0AAE9K6T7_9CAUD|nr:hypothetical protein [Stenotrophomonas phage vB_SmeS_BUCT700]UNY50309.1 hypothetical protein [Stenotrophomonas phage vB_SmeS_BUCT703]
MARSFNTTVKYKRNRETIVVDARKAVRRDRTKIITTEVNDYHDSVQCSERRDIGIGSMYGLA